MSTKVLEKIDKIESDLFDLKRTLYKELPDVVDFYDDPYEIKEIVKAVEQTRKQIWKEEYEGKI